jgi:chlorophyll synthase
MAGALPDLRIIALAALYSIGAHGIMTLNDFKAIEGDRQMGIRTIPVQIGPENAARLACAVMALPQLVVVALLIGWDTPWHGGIVAALLIAQFFLMRRLLTDPRKHAPWYNATGTTLYVLGMMVSAFAVSGLIGRVA